MVVPWVRKAELDKAVGLLFICHGLKAHNHNLRKQFARSRCIDMRPGRHSEPLRFLKSAGFLFFNTQGRRGICPYIGRKEKMTQINGTINNERVLGFDTHRGYVGEQRAQELVITLGPMAGDFDYYLLKFQTGAYDGSFRSNRIRGEDSEPCSLIDGKIHCPLAQKHTATGVLRIQVVAYRLCEDRVTDIVASSVAEITFGESITEVCGGYDYVKGVLDELTELENRLNALEDEVSDLDDTQKQAIFTQTLVAAMEQFKRLDSAKIISYESEEEMQQAAVALAGRFDSDENERLILVCPRSDAGGKVLCLIGENEGGVYTTFYTFDEAMEQARSE